MSAHGMCRHAHAGAIGQGLAHGQENADQRQLQLVRVHIHAQARGRLARRAGLGGLSHLQRHALSQHHGQRAPHPRQPAVQIHHQRMRAVARPEAQQLLRQPAGRVHRTQHGLCRQAQVRVLRTTLNQIGAVAQNAELVVELMGEAACQPADHLQALVLDMGLAGFVVPLPRCAAGLAAPGRPHRVRPATQGQPRQAQAGQRKQHDRRPDHAPQERGTRRIQRGTGNPAHPGPALGRPAEENAQGAALRIGHIQPAVRQAGSQALAEISGQGRLTRCRSRAGRHRTARAVHQKAGPSRLQQRLDGSQRLLGIGSAWLLPVQQAGRGHAGDANGLLLRRVPGLIGAQQQPGRGGQHKHQQGQKQQDPSQAHGHGWPACGAARPALRDCIEGSRRRDRVKTGGLVHGKVCRKPCARAEIFTAGALSGPAVAKPIPAATAEPRAPVPSAQQVRSRFRAQSVSRRFATLIGA